jgi:hypothetical protein
MPQLRAGRLTVKKKPAMSELTMRIGIASRLNFGMLTLLDKIMSS